jgi:putative acetyltransferase
METAMVSFKILDYNPQFKETFKTLNLEWMRQYKIDLYREAILNDPEAHIINKGGAIFFVEMDKKIVATCALIRESNKVFEIADMAVTPQYQGLHIGKSLLQNAIEKAKAKGAKQIYVVVNNTLKPALEMYSAYSFREVPFDPEMGGHGDNEIKMVLNLK